MVQHNLFLMIASVLSAIAALLHLACIYFGAPLFRFLGTAAMAEMVEAGHYKYPVIACLILTVMLLICSAYALSGAGLLPKLPLLRVGLLCITAMYLIRGIAFPLIINYFPENSMQFWYVSSSIVFTIGVIHLIGIVQTWHRL